MGVHLHLFRRDNVFQWRRRLPAQSTETCVLQISLRTTDQHPARIVARRLTAESDHMLDFIRQETLTPADASKWLRHVVTEKLARIRKDRTLIFADGNSDPQADWAMAAAWRMLATRGVNAEVEDEDRANLAGKGRSPSDIHQLDLTLDILAQDIRSESRIRKMARLSGSDRARRPPAHANAAHAA